MSTFNIHSHFEPGAHAEAVIDELGAWLRIYPTAEKDSCITLFPRNVPAEKIAALADCFNDVMAPVVAKAEAA